MDAGADAPEPGSVDVSRELPWKICAAGILRPRRRETRGRDCVRWLGLLASWILIIADGVATEFKVS